VILYVYEGKNGTVIFKMHKLSAEQEADKQLKYHGITRISLSTT
jgi:hypothetical protein